LLVELQIRNFAIIDELSVSFDPGLTVITGETGAGKSILVNAINLLLGSRGSGELIRGGSREATVTGMFHLADRSLANEFPEELDGFSGPEIVVKRTLAATGRNRAYINGQLTTLGALGGLCRGLISISGQHEHQLFLEPETHLEIIDRFGGLETKRQLYQEAFAQLKQHQAGLKELKRRAMERQEKEELWSFQLEEIRSARMQLDEEGILAEERDRLKHVERLQQDTARALQILYAEEGAVFEEMSRCQKLMAELGSLDNSLQPVAEVLEEIRLQVEDIALTLRDYGEKVQADPQRLQWIEERSHTLHRLMRKYGGSTRSALAYADELKAELETAQGDEAEIEIKEAAMAKSRQQTLSAALALSEARRKTAGSLSKAVEKGLASLDMPRCCFGVDFDSDRGSEPGSVQVGEYHLDGRGIDRVTFLFSANPGEDPKTMAKIASGGELSRIVLALKELMAKETVQESLVFDEVDSGIGGGTADRVGQRLKALSERHQVLCITHLPQIACYGDQHYVVRKSARKGRTFTTIQGITGEERLEEIARMLGGAKISKKTRAHAREMLAQAQKQTI
jgi:DNA repair protein RecN (Recombination protein N)